MPKYRICDLINQIDGFSPVRIFIDDVKVWDDDDFDITDIQETYDPNHDYWINEFNTRVAAHTGKFYSILAKEDYVIEITFKIVDFHHTEVYIKTK